MSANTLHLTVASVGETLFDGATLSVTLPGSEGEFEVLPNHEPIIATLRNGIVLIKVDDSDVRRIKIEGGIVECTREQCVVLL